MENCKISGKSLGIFRWMISVNLGSYAFGKIGRSHLFRIILYDENMRADSGILIHKGMPD